MDSQIVRDSTCLEFPTLVDQEHERSLASALYEDVNHVVGQSRTCLELNNGTQEIPQDAVELLPFEHPGH